MGRLLFAALGILAFWLLAPPVDAGGWVVLTLDDWPAEVRAGEELTLGFTVRQHGQTLAPGLTPQLIADHAGTGQQLTVAATESGRRGHYEARITFPSAGAWSWRMTADPFPQEFTFPTLAVLPGTAPVASPAPAGPVWLPGDLAATLRAAGLAFLGVAGVLYALAALTAWRRRRFAAPVPAGGGS